VPNRNGDLPLHNGDPAQPNDAYFRYMDTLIGMAAAHGLYIALLPTCTDLVLMLDDVDKNYPSLTILAGLAKDFGVSSVERWGIKPQNPGLAPAGTPPPNVRRHNILPGLPYSVCN